MGSRKIVKTKHGFAVMDPDGSIGADDLDLNGARLVLKTRNMKDKKNNSLLNDPMGPDIELGSF